MTFPRIAALAEVLWSPREVRSWDDFSRRIQLFMKRYDQIGINYSKSAYKVIAKTEFNAEKKQLAIRLSCELGGTEIHYTTDGSEPTDSSAIYTEPVLLDSTSSLKAVTIVKGLPAANSMSYSFNINKATVKPVKYLIPYSENYKGSGEYTLVNGVRRSTNHSDGEWQAWEGTDMDVVIDLQQTTEIHRISVGTLQNIGAWIFLPRKLSFYISDDGLYFRKVAEKINEADPLSGENQLKDFSVDFDPVMASYIKVIAYKLEEIPKGHMGAGQPAWLFVDEISVE